jgi:predicted transcriptional regulator
LFAMGIVYTFIGVLIIQKKITDLQKNHKSLADSVHDIDNDTTQRINRRDDLLNQRIDEVISNTANDIDETHKYIDKRIDKTIELLQGNINSVYKETEKLNS